MAPIEFIIPFNMHLTKFSIQVLLTTLRSALSPKGGDAKASAVGDDHGSSTAMDTKRPSQRQGPDRSGKPTGQASRRLESGLGVLDNNAVNFLMALIMSVGAMLASAWYWGVPLGSVV